ncbi:EAL domain-containing protein [Litoribacillus peritrichatus]|uniref:EAL domain-containing protein n=1 Tax=Litoribacillus peritrichatus TaxID=718191 RepID=A0ABP7MTR4_9GAMM
MNQAVFLDTQSEYFVLIVEDDEKDAECISGCLDELGLNLHYQVVRDRLQFQQALNEQHLHLIISDCNLPGLPLEYIIDCSHEAFEDIPIIIVAGGLTEDRASEILRTGLRDFISKNDLSRLAPAIKRELKERELRLEQRYAQSFLLRQSALLDSIINSQRDASIIVNARTEIEFWNLPAEKLFQYQTIEIIGQKINQILYRPQNLSSQFSSLKSYVFDELRLLCPATVELLLSAKNNRPLPAELTIQPFEVEGETKYNLVIRDISKLLQDRVKNKLKAEYAIANARLLESLADAQSIQTLCFDVISRFLGLSNIKSLLVNLLIRESENKHHLVQKGFDVEEGIIEEQPIHFIFDDQHVSERPMVNPVQFSTIPRSTSYELNEIDGPCLWVPLVPVGGDSESHDVMIVSLEFGTEFESFELKLIAELAKTAANILKAFIDNLKRMKLERAVEMCPSSIVITDREGSIEYVNQKLIENSGYSAEEIIGSKTSLFSSGQTSSAVYIDLWNTIQSGKSWIGEIQNKKKNGALYWEKLNIFPVSNASGEIINYVGIKEDITNQKESRKKLDYLSTHDNVTGLSNRALFLDRLEQAIEQHKASESKFAVLLLNVKNFRQYNELFGYLICNALLKRISEVLITQLDSSESISRAPGAEFLILIPNITSLDSLTERYLQIIEGFQKPTIFNDNELDIQFCSGAAIYPVHGDTSDQLITLVEETRYLSKGSNERNKLHFSSPVVQGYSISRTQFKAKIKKALEQDEFELFYQPQVDSSTGQVIGCEALIRWFSKDQGMISPTVFIPVAEECQLIVDIGNWALNAACAQLKEWQAYVPAKFTVAINLSTRHLASLDLVNYVEELINKYEIDPTMLEFEITESAIIENLEGTVDVLRQLQILGCSISVDDFGTGYSNLTYLRQIPLDRLKIDRCFIKEMAYILEDASLSRMIIQISHTLGLEVVAEGVETEAQYHLLKKFNCDFFQGFYFSKPKPAAEVLELIKAPTWKLKAEDSKDTLLIIDDEKAILSALKRILKRKPYKVMTTTNPMEALEILAANDVGVIISDQRMPAMAGTELLRRVKSMHPDTVRIMLSGFTDVETLSRAVNEGSIYKFIHKPWEDQDLIEEIDNAFEVYAENKAKHHS